MTMKNRILTICFLFFFGIPNYSNCTTRYVKQNGDGNFDGSSWNNAAVGINLQTIINSSAIGDEVWVACGTYLPTTGSNRTISFSMKEGVLIFGGFQGTETLLSERAFSCGSCSILSGEIGASGISDNSYKVIYNSNLTNTAIIDGFIIRDGNDDRTPNSSGNGLGGGVYNHGYNPGGFCHPTIRNCIFTNNRASWGGGAFNNGYNNGNTEPTYINCVFHQNHAYIEAGGMDSYGVAGNASPTLINTIFYANTSATNVGAMYVWGGNAGGDAHPILINCVFANNQALNGYGGAFIADNLDENGTTSSGSCTVTLQNCIVWNNSATAVGPQFYIKGTGAQILATYSTINITNQNSPHVLSGAGTGNITSNPLFVSISDALGIDNCWFTADDGLRLQNSSPCIDAGNNLNSYSNDITGNNRLVGSNVDMGAYELEVVSTNNIEHTNASKSRIFPNPSSGIVTIENESIIGTEISVLNVVGSDVTKDVTILSQNLFTTKLSVEFLPAGLYYIKFQDSIIKVFKK